MNDLTKKLLNAEMTLLLKNSGYEDCPLSVDDVPIPIIKIVQKGSDAILDSNSEAKIGMLYNMATEELLGTTIDIIPYFFEAKYVMRTPMDAGGGFAGSFKDKPEDFTDFVEGRWFSKNSPNMEVLYTHYHAVLINGNQRAIIPMNSTQLKISKKWNVVFRNQATGPIFMKMFNITTMDQRVGNFTFKGWSKPTYVRDSSVKEVKMAIEYYKFNKKMSLENTPKDMDMRSSHMGEQANNLDIDV